LSTIEVIFKSPACINASFLLANDAHYCCSSKNSGVDIQLAVEAFDYLRKSENESIKHTIWDSITEDLIPSLSTKPADVETLRVYMTIPLYHEFINSKNYMRLHTPFGECILQLGELPLKIILSWWTLQSRDYYERLVENFKGVVAFIINAQMKRVVSQLGDKQMVCHDKHLVVALNVLLMLFRINHQERKQKVPYESFALPELSEVLDIRQDYVQWLQDPTVSPPSLYHGFWFMRIIFFFSYFFFSPTNFICVVIHFCSMQPPK
jgi:E3 ubiquitin-protein ligase HERC4